MELATYIETICIDPLGVAVAIPEEWSQVDALAHYTNELYDAPATLIQAPAILLQSYDPLKERYYYRSLGWMQSFLLIVRQLDSRWVACELIQNPDASFMATLYGKAREIDLRSLTLSPSIQHR